MTLHISGMSIRIESISDVMRVNRSEASASDNERRVCFRSNRPVNAPRRRSDKPADEYAKADSDT